MPTKPVSLMALIMGIQVLFCAGGLADRHVRIVEKILLEKVTREGV